MPRHGITYNDIANAAAKLLADNKTVTVSNIREVTQTGSLSTIASHLRRWRTQQTQQGQSLLKSELPEALTHALQGLWSAVTAEANEKIEFATNKCTEETAAAHKKTQQLAEKCQQWLEKHEQLNNEHNDLTERHKKLIKQRVDCEQQLALIQNEKKSLQQHIEDKQQHIDELNHLHQQTQTNYEHYQEQMKEQRDAEQQQFTNQMSLLQQSNGQLLQEKNILNQQLLAQQQQNQTLLSNNMKFTTSLAKLEQENQALEKTLEQHLKLEKSHKILEELNIEQRFEIKLLNQKQKTEEKLKQDLIEKINTIEHDNKELKAINNLQKQQILINNKKISELNEQLYAAETT